MTSEVTTVDWATLVFALIAAAPATPVAVWGWIDRPQYGWTFRTGRPPVLRPIEGGVAVRTRDPEVDHEVEVEVYAIGTATVINVDLQFSGCTTAGKENVLNSGRMNNGSPPLSATVHVPAAATGSDEAWAEAIWQRPRPSTRFGNRINLRTDEVQRWRWYWWSLRPRRVVGSRFRLRLIRTRGHWVPASGPPLPSLEERAKKKRREG